MKLEDAVLEVLRGSPEKSFSYGDPELQRLLPDVDRQTIDFALHNLSTKGLIWKRYYFGALPEPTTQANRRKAS